MAIGDVIALTFNGVYCSVPVSIGMAYTQLADPPPGEFPGKRLIERWLNEVNGAWRSISFAISDQLAWECASAVYGDTAETGFLSGATGGSAAASVPTPLAIQVNMDSQDPHPGSRPGRFYMPGLVQSHLDGGGFTNVAEGVLNPWMVALIEVDDMGGGLGPRYRLYPHPKYLTRNGDTNINAERPYYNPFMKVIGNRRADACTTFVGQGGAGFSPIPVDPAPAPPV